MRPGMPAPARGLAGATPETPAPPSGSATTTGTSAEASQYLTAGPSDPRPTNAFRQIHRQRQPRGGGGPGRHAGARA